MPAAVRPYNIALPDRLAHRRRHDEVVARGESERGTGQSCLLGPCVPGPEPIESSGERFNIERVLRREGLRAASLPEGAQGHVSVSLKVPLHAKHARLWDVAGEAIEALNADE